MKTRVLSSIIMLPLLVFIILGGVPLGVILIILSALAMKEFYDGYEHIDIHAFRFFAYIMLVLLYAIIAWGEFMGGDGKVYAHLMWLWTFAVSFGGVVAAVFNKDNNILDGPVTSLGIFYIAFFMSHLVLIDQLPKYTLMIWLVFLTAFGTDISAYFTGYFLGKHKLCPKLSAKKTVEGAIGGIVGSTVLSGVFGYIFFRELLLHTLVMGFLGSFIAQFGDLSASAFKRKMGIKDYGTLIPGHGGVMDRFDSILFTAPFIYYYIIVILKP